MEGKQKYLAKFWRNDGGWKSSGYNYNPCYIFEAANDEEALRIAITYTVSNKQTGEDFWLDGLWKIRDIPFDYETRNKIERSIGIDDQKKPGLASRRSNNVEPYNSPKKKRSIHPKRSHRNPCPKSVIKSMLIPIYT
jgi:hypothetical protein